MAFERFLACDDITATVRDLNQVIFSYCSSLKVCLFIIYQWQENRDQSDEQHGVNGVKLKTRDVKLGSTPRSN